MHAKSYKASQSDLSLPFELVPLDVILIGITEVEFTELQLKKKKQKQQQQNNVTKHRNYISLTPYQTLTKQNIIKLYHSFLQILPTY